MQPNEVEIRHGQFGPQGLDWQDLCRRPLNNATNNTKYVSSGPHGFREKDFLSFSHYKSMGANDPQGVACLGPRGLIGRIYVGDHSTLLHTKYVSCGPHGFREEDFLIFFFHYMGANDPRGVASGPQGLDWQDLCRGPLNIATN